MKVLLLACALVMFSPALHAADFKMDGNQLRDDCKNSDTGSGYNDGECLGFVIGVDAGYEMDRGVDGMKSHLCIPEGVTYGQLVKVVVKFLNDHPEELHHPAALLTLNALIGAFPCPWDSTKPKK